MCGARTPGNAGRESWLEAEESSAATGGKDTAAAQGIPAISQGVSAGHGASSGEETTCAAAPFEKSIAAAGCGIRISPPPLMPIAKLLPATVR